MEGPASPFDLDRWKEEELPLLFDLVRFDNDNDLRNVVLVLLLLLMLLLLSRTSISICIERPPLVDKSNG